MQALTALDDAGTQADIDVFELLYLEQWRLHELLNNDTPVRSRFE
jgi:hypothetical protein